MEYIKEFNAERAIRITFYYMLILNFIIVAFHACILTMTQIRAASSYSVSRMFNYLNIVPQNPYTRIVITAGCCLIIFYAIYVKGRYIKEKNIHFVLFFLIEFFAAFILMWELNMSTNAVVFLITAEAIARTHDRGNQIQFVMISFIFYVLCNYHTFSYVSPINNINIWIEYYNADVSSLFYILKNVLECVNILLFLLFVMLLLIWNNKEKEQIEILNDTLQKANDQLLEYAATKEQMGEMKERNRIAREIHDSVGHKLTGLSFGLEALPILMEANPDLAMKQIDTLSDTARSTLDDMRRSVRKLAPDALERLGLEQSIYKLIEDTSKVTDVRIFFVSHVDKLLFEADEEKAIYRIIQESVTNAIKHGSASRIWIDINKKVDENTGNETLHVMIRNNGAIKKDYKEGFGLTHMRERVELLGGELTTEAIEGLGFKVLAKIPIRVNKRK